MGVALLQMVNDRVVDVDARHPVVAPKLGRAHVEQRQVPLEVSLLLRLGRNACESFVSSRLQSCDRGLRSEGTACKSVYLKYERGPGAVIAPRLVARARGARKAICTNLL